MKNLFRKIRQEQLSNNDIIKYLKYALGEIFLVVIGILIALQINNWNINRLDKAREIKYLKNIKLDLTNDLEKLNSSIQTRQAKNEATKKVIGHINGSKIEDLTELSKSIVLTLYEERFQPNNIAFKELVNSGNVNIISNDSIKTLMFELELLYQKNNFGIDHESFDYQEYISKPLIKNIDIEKLLAVYFGKKTAKEQNIEEKEFQAILSNKEYKNGCVISNILNEDFMERYQDIILKSKKALSLISKEI